MIFNLSGGGTNLNFKIVGSTIQPTNPTENMIWVNTDVEITGWCFSIVKPEVVSNGDVWIRISSFSTSPFNVLKENGIQVYPIFAKQYINGVWIDKTAKIYQNGEWIDWIVFLFNGGNQVKDVTGGWTFENYHGDAVGSIGTTMSFVTNASANPWCWFQTKNKIDLTSATWVKVLVTTTRVDNNVLLGISEKYYATNSLHPTSQSYIAQTTTSSVGTDIELKVNVSSLSGEYYIVLKNTSSIGSFTKVWLE